MNNKLSQIQWQAEDDARTMARYEEIMADNVRKTRAIKAQDLNKRAKAMNKVAKGGKRK